MILVLGCFVVVGGLVRRVRGGLVFTVVGRVVGFWAGGDVGEGRALV